MDEFLAYSELKAQSVETLRSSELSEHAATLESWLAPAIQFSSEDVSDDEGLPLGASKIGGCPDLPSDFAWPYWQDEPLTFIAQFNLAEVAPFDIEGALPSSGLLSFWSRLRSSASLEDDCDLHGEIGDHPDSYGAWRVIYIPKTDALCRIQPPISDEHFCYPTQAISRFYNTMSLPDTSSLEWRDYFGADADNFDREDDDFHAEEAYYDLRDEIPWLAGGDHQLLGHAIFRQYDARVTCATVSSGLQSDSNLLPEEQLNFEAAARRWRSLLQLYSRDDMSWAGDGYCYFFIPSDDLAAQRWDKTWFAVQR